MGKNFADLREKYDCSGKLDAKKLNFSPHAFFLAQINTKINVELKFMDINGELTIRSYRFAVTTILGLTINSFTL